LRHVVMTAVSPADRRCGWRSERRRNPYHRPIIDAYQAPWGGPKFSNQLSPGSGARVALLLSRPLRNAGGPSVLHSVEHVQLITAGKVSDPAAVYQACGDGGTCVFFSHGPADGYRRPGSMRRHLPPASPGGAQVAGWWALIPAPRPEPPRFRIRWTTLVGAGWVSATLSGRCHRWR